MGRNHHSALDSVLLQFDQAEDLSLFDSLDIFSLNNKKEDKEDINKRDEDPIDRALIVSLSKKINITLRYDKLR